MKRINLLLMVFSLLTIGLLNESCKKDESCPEISCNIGTLNEETCACDCPEGYTGTNCENFDPSQVQVLLDGGKTPKELFDGGVPLESLYGKMYKGGIIFYLDTDDGTGMVAATEDQSTEAKWGCFDTDIMDLMNVTECPGMGDCAQPLPEDTFEGARIGDGVANTDAILAECTTDGIAAKLCRDLGEDWFLPSRGELNLMWTNLADSDGNDFNQGPDDPGNLGGFVAGFYWSSTEEDFQDAWGQLFNFGGQEISYKEFGLRFRAARAF